MSFQEPDTLFKEPDTLFQEVDMSFQEHDTLFKEADTLFQEFDTSFHEPDTLFQEWRVREWRRMKIILLLLPATPNQKFQPARSGRSRDLPGPPGKIAVSSARDLTGLGLKGLKVRFWDLVLGKLVHYDTVHYISEVVPY